MNISVFNNNINTQYIQDNMTRQKSQYKVLLAYNMRSLLKLFCEIDVNVPTLSKSPERVHS